ncbi:MAG: exosortase B [Zoogloeaceae bacterium]|jgi:exosortase B|nr:exosortase B [Zoogloeaceae bacterium]
MVEDSPVHKLTRPSCGLSLVPWLLVGIGLCAMYLPTFIDLFQGIWSTDQQGHGPIVLAITIWLLYRKWPEMCAARETRPPSLTAWIILGVGLLLYILGRSQELILFETGSMIWVLLACGLLLFGARAMKVIWFPFFFMLFMIPLPGVIVDTLTQPMKLAVSYVTEQGLYAIGYPIARAGVVLYIGQYQLLVADACAGLNTLFTLESMGLLYLNLVRHESVLRNTVLAILIVPISFAANVIRVMVLTLITYHFGDEAGQGFLHGFAGMVLFLSALLLIIGVDSLTRTLFVRKSPANP